MELSNSLHIAASGMRDAQTRLDVAANNIANSNTNNYVPDGVESQAVPSGGVKALIEPGVKPYFSALPPEGFHSQTDITEELINTLKAKRAYQANAATVRADEEKWEAMRQNHPKRHRVDIAH